MCSRNNNTSSVRGKWYLRAASRTFSMSMLSKNSLTSHKELAEARPSSSADSSRKERLRACLRAEPQTTASSQGSAVSSTQTERPLLRSLIHRRWIHGIMPRPLSPTFFTNQRNSNGEKLPWPGGMSLGTVDDVEKLLLSSYGQAG